MRTFLIAFLITSFCTESRAQVDTLRAEIVSLSDESYEAVFGAGSACDLGCAIGWRYETTSHLPAQDSNRYTADLLGDANPHTAWVEGAHGVGIGQAVIIHFQPADVIDVPFYGLAVQNGYAKDGAMWRANGRVHHLALRHGEEVVFIIELIDTMEPQRVAWPAEWVIISGGETVTLEIRSVYPGERYTDTALSNLNLFGAH